MQQSAVSSDSVVDRANLMPDLDFWVPLQFPTRYLQILLKSALFPKNMVTDGYLPILVWAVSGRLQVGVEPVGVAVG